MIKVSPMRIAQVDAVRLLADDSGSQLCLVFEQLGWLQAQSRDVRRSAGAGELDLLSRLIDGIQASRSRGREGAPRLELLGGISVPVPVPVPTNRRRDMARFEVGALFTARLPQRMLSVRFVGAAAEAPEGVADKKFAVRRPDQYSGAAVTNRVTAFVLRNRSAWKGAPYSDLGLQRELKAAGCVIPAFDEPPAVSDLVATSSGRLAKLTKAQRLAEAVLVPEAQTRCRVGSSRQGPSHRAGISQFSAQVTYGRNRPGIVSPQLPADCRRLFRHVLRRRCRASSESRMG